MNFNGDLELVNAGCFKPDEPLITKFLLMEDDKNHPCPRFYGKTEDKKKVYHALKEDIHPEVHAKWGQLECLCHYIPKIRFSKTARNRNKVFPTCGVPYSRRPPCRYFQWIHTPLYPLPLEPTPEWLVKFTASRQPYKPRSLKSVTKQTQAEWLQQAEQNVEQWKREQGNKALLNQFAKSSQKQKELQKKKQVLSTFGWSPEETEYYEKQKVQHKVWNPPLGSEQFEKNEKKQSFGWLTPSDASLASYLQKQKEKSKTLPPLMESFYKNVNMYANKSLKSSPPLECCLRKY